MQSASQHKMAQRGGQVAEQIVAGSGDDVLLRPATLKGLNRA